MPAPRLTLAAGSIAHLTGLLFLSGIGQQAPTFRASADLVLVDAQVVARDGRPIENLTAAQFEVFIDGRRRPIVAAEFVPMVGGGPPAVGAESGVAAAPDGRVIVLAVDQPSFPVIAEQSAREAVSRVIERVAPSDYVGLVAWPGVEIAPTRDRGIVRDALSRVAGMRVDAIKSRFNLSVSEAAQLHARAPVVTRDLICRECRGCPIPDQNCGQALMDDARSMSTALEAQGVASIAGFQRVLDLLESIPGRKTLIVVSAGLPMSTVPGSRPDFNAETARIARRAASGNISLYVLYLNVHFLRFFSPAYGKINHAIYDDISMFGYGLEKFADGGGGAFFQIEVDSDPFVDRVLRETSASYILAVRVEPQDRDGKEHFIRVTARARGATVRYRKMVVIPAGSG
jgi:VWFA-related protein